MSSSSRSDAATILLVDDNVHIRANMRKILARTWRVVEAGDVGTAVDILSTDMRFDLVICDYFLPGGSGDDVLRASRRGDPKRPVILVSGIDDVPSASFDDVLAKPFFAAELVAIVAASLAKRSAR